MTYRERITIVRPDGTQRPRRTGRAVVACGVLTVLLAACGGDSAAPPPPDVETPVDQETTDIVIDTAAGPAGSEDSDAPDDPERADVTPPPSATPDTVIPDAPVPNDEASGAGCNVDLPPVRLALQTPTDALPAGVLATRIATGIASLGPACPDVFPGGSLFDADGALDALTSGELEVAIVSLAELSARMPEYALFDLPYLFEDIAALERFRTGDGGAALLQGTSRDGLRPIGFVGMGLVQTSADRAVVAPADLVGTRVVGRDSALFRAQYEALDAFPIQTALRERYTALLTGVVDAQESLWSVAAAQRFAEVQSFFTETNHRVSGHALIVGADWWSALDPDDRAALARLFADALATTGADAREAQAAARRAIVTTGVEVSTLDAEERAAWVEAMQPVWRASEDAIGVDLIGAALASNGDGTDRVPTPITPDTRPLDDNTSPTRSDRHPAEALVVDSTEALLVALRASPTGADGVLETADVEPIVRAAFDVETMTSLALGAAQRDADPAQLTRLVDEFGTLLSRTYANALSPYRNGELGVEPFVPQARTDRAVIGSTLTGTGLPTLSLVHRLRERDGWTVYDVELDGFSLVTGFRATFADIVEREGIDALIEELVRRNDAA